MSVRARILSGFVLLIAVMLGFAAGSIWMLVVLYSRQPAPWFALLVGAWLAWILRAWVHPPGLTCAALAALATCMAALWVNALLVGVQLAGNMGLSLLEAIYTAGGGMLWQLIWLVMRPVDIAWIGGAMVLAALIAARPAWR